MQGQVLMVRLDYLTREIRKEERSLRYLVTLTDPRAQKGTSIVKLTVAQLKTERRWVKDLLADIDA